MRKHHELHCASLRFTGLDVNSYVYWGSPHHHYSTASSTSLPTHCPYGILAADLDDDGRNDIVFTRMNDVAYGDSS